MTRRAGAVVLVALLGAGGSGTTRSPEPDLVHVRPNDNRIPAGELANGVLTVHLEVRRGVWHPEGPAGDSVTAAVFAEEGKAPQVPGPLIRVPAGTVIEATVRNRLPDSAVTVQGLATRPATRDDGLRIPPGEARTVRFAAGDPGTYLYAARVGAGDTTIEREQLAGALFIDSAGARADDRIFVINIWGEPSRADTTIYRNALTINGLSWPHTERITATVGDTAR
ncbi:MAG TPA: multicopper oxidase domain-containing protein, partial [Gemmatimonadales bacterium]